MKRCPQCGREYAATMMFCLDDGRESFYDPAARVLPEKGARRDDRALPSYRVASSRQEWIDSELERALSNT